MGQTLRRTFNSRRLFASAYTRVTKSGTKPTKMNIFGVSVTRLAS
jgi:hypothetical protein